MPKHKSMKKIFSSPRPLQMAKIKKLFRTAENPENFSQRNFPMAKLSFPLEKRCCTVRRSFKVENYRDKSREQSPARKCNKNVFSVWKQIATPQKFRLGLEGGK